MVMRSRKHQVKLITALFLMFTSFSFAQVKKNELVIATTFSPDATAYIISRWRTQPQSVIIRTLNRTSASLEQLLDAAGGENIDLVLTSSPMLLQHLQEHHRLAAYPDAPPQSQRLVPESIRGTAVAVAISGFGLLINQGNLNERHLPQPANWDDLIQGRYQGTVLMSSPSRSDTNHLMVESLLQQSGWQHGWETILSLAGNLVTISSRSFGVADKIKSGLGSVGPVIDNYANLLLDDPNLTFRYFPHSAASPTYVALINNTQSPAQARRFIQFLLSPEGQLALSDTDTGKYSIIPSRDGSARARQQQRLLSAPPLNYRLILQRQRLVQKLFDTAISFRLPQLKDAWRALHSAETRLKRPLPEVRALLTALPVSEQQSTDAHYLARWENKAQAEQLMMEWQLFFQEHQRQAIDKLENLK